MPINGIDHFAILTEDAIATAEFYAFIMDLEHGPRPNFSTPGVWLYSKDDPILHILEVAEAPTARSVLDHVAFRGSGLTSFIERLTSRDIRYDLRRVPEGVSGSGTWQLFFNDPNGARVEIGFPANESAPHGAQTRDPVEAAT